MSETHQRSGRSITATRIKRIEPQFSLIESEVADALAACGALSSSLSFTPMEEFIKTFRSNYTAVNLPSGRTLAVAKRKDATFFSTSGQSVH
jgi:hypothetical protein